jgi:hypothetical protein
MVKCVVCNAELTLGLDFGGHMEKHNVDKAIDSLWLGKASSTSKATGLQGRIERGRHTRDDDDSNAIAAPPPFDNTMITRLNMVGITREMFDVAPKWREILTASYAAVNITRKRYKVAFDVAWESCYTFACCNMDYVFSLSPKPSAERIADGVREEFATRPPLSLDLDDGEEREAWLYSQGVVDMYRSESLQAIADAAYERYGINPAEYATGWDWLIAVDEVADAVEQANTTLSSLRKALWTLQRTEAQAINAEHRRERSKAFLASRKSRTPSAVKVNHA